MVRNVRGIAQVPQRLIQNELSRHDAIAPSDDEISGGALIQITGV
jgi:hypothetical protein